MKSIDLDIIKHFDDQFNHLGLLNYLRKECLSPTLLVDTERAAVSLLKLLESTLLAVWRVVAMKARILELFYWLLQLLDLLKDPLKKL